MYISFYETVPAIKDFLTRENPKSVLTAGFSSKKYAALISYIMENQSVTIDKVDIEGTGTPDFPDQRVYPLDCLMDGHDLKKYDLVFIADVFENVLPEVAFKILDTALAAANQSVFVMIPYISDDKTGSGAQRRIYHPTMFKKFDFSYIVLQTVYGKVQMYTFFPNKRNKPYIRRQIDIKPIPEQKLRLGYILPHKGLTGGVKCLLEQMRQLHRRGHKVYAVYKGQKGESAIPDWSDIDPENDIDGQIILTDQNDANQLCGLVDAVMLGFLDQIPKYAGTLSVPIVYWEQGYEVFYGDSKQLFDSHCQVLKNLRLIYGLNVNFLAVSDTVSEILHYKYGVESHLMYNGIDTSKYFPLKDKKFTSTILLVGNPTLLFKNFEFVLNALNYAWEQGCRFRVKWACQVNPGLDGLKFPIEYYVMVSQQKLAELYRTSDIFLSTSVYESFPMPPIEAMASGIPVIATDCGGIRTYGKAGENLLLVDQGDMQSFTAALKFLLENEGARKKLSENGLATAQKYSYSNMIKTLESYYYTLTGKGGDRQ